MFESVFQHSPCEFVAEELQADEQMHAASVSFRVVDKDAWGGLLPSVVANAHDYRSDFSLSGPKKEFFFDEETEQVKFLWAFYVWAADETGLRMAARVLAQLFTQKRLAPPKPPAPTLARPKAAKVGPARRPISPADEPPPGDPQKLVGSPRAKRTVVGRTSDGTEKAFTVIPLGRRKRGEHIYVAEDPEKTVKPTRPSATDNPAESARTGIRGKPRVHVAGMTADEGGIPAGAGDL